MGEMTRRVVISGCGVVSPIGGSAEAVWDSLSNRRSGVDVIQSVPTETLPIKAAGEVSEFTGHISNFGQLDGAVKKTIRKGLKVMCREIEMGVAVAQLAMQSSQLDLSQLDPERIGIVYGSDYIMTHPDEFTAGVAACLEGDRPFDFSDWADKGMPRVTPLWLLKYLPNMPACHVAIYNDLRGPNNSLTVREASANLAIGEAVSTIQRGAADQMIVGATGSRIHPLRTVHTVLQEQLATGEGDPTTLSRPFDLHRQGMVVGEGAAALVLEDLASAQQRGATIWGEVVGAGASSVVGRDGMAKRDAALVNAIKATLANAKSSPADIGHVNAHGLGTTRGDIAEARALQPLVSEAGLPVVAVKSYFGNLGAAGGMVELVASLMALKHGHLFATLNYDTPDPECPLPIVTDASRPSGDAVLNLNVSPQAQASAVLVRRFKA